MRAPSFSLHIHDPPKVAALAVILRASITNPPVSICLTIMSIFHIRPEDSRNAAFTPWCTLWSKIRTIKSESNIDAAIRGLGEGGWSCRMRVKRSIQIKSRLWGNRVLERLLAFCVHYCYLEIRAVDKG